MKDYYVYIYWDTRGGKRIPFYVGMGRGDRYKQHLLETKEGTCNKSKWQRIQDIRCDLEKDPEITFALTSASKETAALVEGVLIHLFGREQYEGGCLTNIMEATYSPRGAVVPRRIDTLETLEVKRWCKEGSALFGPLKNRMSELKKKQGVSV